jgi:1-acyl-sn-glycerol-3-phosphate acyltransferase
VTSPLRAAPSDVLGHRDPAFVRLWLPIIRWWAEVYFRGEVEGIEHIPADGPVLLIGNHSGGTVTPDTHVFNNVFYRRFGVDRPYYQLAHDLVVASPLGPLLKRFGTIPASHENGRVTGVPIVPIASVGGQETALFLARGEWLAHHLHTDS